MKWFILGVSGLALSACGPTNQEDCISRAAKEAKTTQGLNLLTDVCRTKFPAKLSSEGKYVYTDPYSNMSFEVSGPTLSPKELEWIASERKAAESNKAKIEAQLETVRNNIQIVDYKISCNNEMEFIKCYDKNITVRLRNNSNVKISSVEIQYEIGRQIDCGGGLGKSFYEEIEILPQGTATVVRNVKFTNAGPDGVMSGCVKVGQVSLAN